MLENAILRGSLGVGNSEPGLRHTASTSSLRHRKSVDAGMRSSHTSMPKTPGERSIKSEPSPLNAPSSHSGWVPANTDSKGASNARRRVEQPSNGGTAELGIPS